LADERGAGPMSTLYPRLPSTAGGAHPAVRRRRSRERLMIALAALAALAAALGISLLVSKPNLLLVFGFLLGALGIVALLTNRHLEKTVLVLALYLGLLDGPVKLGTGGHEAASALRDVLIFSVAIGALARMIAQRKRISLPPMSAWVLGFVVAVLIEAFNPKTQGLVKTLGGFRQQLEWVPFFFFGYAVMRSKGRFRKLFIVLGVVALANGAVATYQTRLAPSQLASWGPGYNNLVFGNKVVGKKGGLTGRTYSVEGEAKVRPPGLGSDAGFGGGVGVLALPATLALIATGRGRRRWLYIPLALGAAVAVATGLGRLQVVGGIVAVLMFALLSFTAGRRVTRPLAALLAVIIIAVPLGAIFVSATGSGTYDRYSSLAEGSSNNSKLSTLEHLPSQLERAPFGVGLGSVGAAAGFGGKVTDLLEGHGVSSETQYNFVSNELGIIGLVLWLSLTGTVIALVARRLRRVVDVELRMQLAAVFATFIAFTIMGCSGPTMTSAAFGPFFWGSVGIAAYWLAGRGNRFRAAIASEEL
jgi:hypothetical protein